MDIKNRKTICFCIFATGKALGGHYRSLRMIAESLSKLYNVLIITFGYTHPDIFKNSEFENYYIYFNGFNYISTTIRAKK